MNGEQVPYIVTTTTPYSLPGGDGSLSRRAVATLDEAREMIIGVLDGLDAAFVDRLLEAKRLPEQGGTIGPLPDGTVIEVERVTLADLAERGRWVGGFDQPDEIMANFNEVVA